MTQEELLANINAAIRDRNADYGLVKGLYALRSVVELHKPDVQGRCDICTWITNGGGVMYEACPTIQAIEKALV